ncbi:unnamed protein product [Gongylonema pulchrum]|uniref:NET domain-containing protein n=1 Tax=Gongylonema pulchrum TaxID=637853 RepID=A0A183CY15_9BILA|nr:unnamed protein product [Gongylonema pulchrum]
MLLVLVLQQLRKAITKLENREISLGDDYDEEVENAHNSRLLKLTRRQLQIYNYFVRKGIFVSDTGEPLTADEHPKLVISSTGFEDLNVLLTEHVNQQMESEAFGCKLRIPYKHVTVDDVKALIEKVKETNEQLFVDLPLEFDQLVQNIACDVNKQVKQFIENRHKSGLADWAAAGKVNEGEDGQSAAAVIDTAEETVEQAISVPTWDAARMEIHEACDRGELDCAEPENSGDVVDTALAATDEEIEEGEEEGKSESLTVASSQLDDDEEMKSDAGFEPDESCCTAGEEVHGGDDGSEDSDCCIIEEIGQAKGGKKMHSDGMECSKITLADALSTVLGKNQAMRNGEESGDDDCCIIED